MKAKRKTPELALRSGRPAAVILDINEYQKLLERLEDLEDLKTLKAMRSRPLTFKRLEDFLSCNATVQHTLLEGCSYRWRTQEGLCVRVRGVRGTSSAV